MVDLLLNWCRIAVGGPRWSYDDCMGYGFGRTGREIRLSARRNDRSARDAHVLGPDQLELSGGACGVSRLLGPRSRSMLSSVMLPASETAEVRESVSVVSAWYEKVRVGWGMSHGLLGMVEEGKDTEECVSMYARGRFPRCSALRSKSSSSSTSRVRFRGGEKIMMGG